MEKRDQGGGSSGKRGVEEDGLDDWEEEFRLPRGHRPVENLDTEGLEQASVDTRLGASNVGFRLLQKMGWKGKGLGKNEQGILEPIKAGTRDAKLGVGKQEQDDFFTAEDNVQRKRLNVELEETEEHVKKREVTAEREQKIRSEVKEIQKTFFCSLCNKQYKLALEFETHLSSYDHNHRKRFKEMRDMQNSSNSNRDDRQKREQQREEKELAKFAQLADAHRKQQQQKQEQPEISGEQVMPQNLPTAGNQDQRRTMKFGFSIMAPFKAPVGNISKKPKIATKVPSVFGNNSDDEGVDAHKKQQQQKQEQPGISAEQVTPKNLPTAGNQDQRRTLKFGFSKMTPSKAPVGSISKKPKIATKVVSVFGNDSDEEA